MAKVLTLASSVTCGHSGTVATTSSTKLRVGGSRVLLKAGVAGKAVAGCTTAPASDAAGPTYKPCTAVASLDPGGVAGKLTAGGVPVALDTLTGRTDGMVNKESPVGGLGADAGHDKLRAA